MSIEIREAYSDDAPAMARLVVDTWLEAHHGQMPDHLWEARRSDWTYDESEQGWRRALASIADGSSPGDHTFVATDNDQVVGVAACAASEDLSSVEVGSLYVLVSHQRKGIGRRLLEVVRARYGKLGAKVLHIGVLAANHPARGFYEAMGGQLAGERETDEQGEKLPEVVYAWDLES